MISIGISAKSIYSLINRYVSFHLRIQCIQRCRLSLMKLPSEITAGVLIIGDEILNGTIEDVNTTFLIKRLNAAGIKVKMVSIIPDETSVISKEALKLSRECTVVLTSGGIGPTHDDVTYEAVAEACGEELHLNEELSALYSNYFGTRSDQNPAIVKFASIPNSAVLNFGDFEHNGKTIKFPLVSVQNIYMLPGVPMLLQKSFQIFEKSFMLCNKPNFKKHIYITKDEFFITPLLNKAVRQFKNKVKFGSYPSFNDNYYRVKLVLESSEEKWLKSAYEYINNELPNQSIIERKEDILLTAKEDVYAISKDLPIVASSISIIEESMKKYKLSDMCFCFNGGKDCTALLHLLYACVQQLNSNEWNELQTLYVKSGDSFREVDNFIQNTVKSYDLNMTTIEGNLKQATIHYLKSKPQIKTVLMGTRRSDPGAENLISLCLTDSSWPSVIRVLPILDWTYQDIWYFIRELQIPYCVLYDRGYTSLGAKYMTLPNPSLLSKDENRHNSYKPAYMLKDSKDERKSRF